MRQPIKELVVLAEARAEAWQALLEQRAKCLRPKDKDVTELDRKVLMDALSAEKEKDYLLLDSLWSLRMVELRMAGTDSQGPCREERDSVTPSDGSSSKLTYSG
jgi:hypothetical protein